MELKSKYHYNNGICNCQDAGLPSSGRDEDRSMFCQLYKCYAYDGWAAAMGECTRLSQRRIPP